MEFKYLLIGVLSLLGSGVIYTMERFISVIQWAANSVPVKLNSSGISMSEPDMPSFVDNIFVIILFVCGLMILGYGVYERRTR
ncbi:hypothetical protein JDW19_14690 [Paenibacillus polymyxa]|uniref:Uncharacterized protein n=1 Tax=Paenibacillus polymyxa TaxID=1406 RepID=A0A8I1J2C2_PAEPO|nr:MULTISPECIES: hypothetical protein [Paenibacillus]KAF6570945.1 hypothetical protein G9G53_19040 [Paenibacillus sp. EKM206P]KAF6587838.1 hypothetical protein G9G52_15515 [Paenibacillus sp. EKM205P]MBM0634354.1 hypothetical protein [Paenibacillus polymyxa]